MRAALHDADLGVLTYAEAARCLDMSRERVRQLVASGVLTISRRYGRLYVSAASVAVEVKRRDKLRRERLVV